MKTITFSVKGQKLTKGSGFTGLARGSENYITARFAFDSDWRNAAKVAEFGKQSVLLEDNACVIPAEVLTRRSFTVRVVGKTGDVKITTNRVTVRQEG